MKTFILGLCLGMLLKMGFSEFSTWLQFKDAQFCVRNVPAAMLECMNARQSWLSRDIINTMAPEPWLFEHFLD